MPPSPHADLTCDCPLVTEARARYEDESANLRRQTSAAWARWEDMPIDARLAWVKGNHRTAHHDNSQGGTR